MQVVRSAYVVCILDQGSNCKVCLWCIRRHISHFNAEAEPFRLPQKCLMYITNKQWVSS